MKNKLTGAEYRALSNKAFYITGIVLAVAYGLQLIAQMLGDTLLLICIFVSFIFMTVAYVYSFKGFSNLKKANAREDTAYPNTGKNFSILNIVFCIVFLILSIGLVFILLSTVILEEEENTNALNNAAIIYGIVYALVNIFSLTTVISLYIYRIFNIEKVEGKQNNFTLFTALFLLMSLGVTVVAYIYDYGSAADDTALTVFAGLLRIASYVVLILFFNKRVKSK